MGEQPMGRREIISKVLGSAALVSATAANADIGYAGVGFRGGSSTIDVNNANIRVYTKLPGMYPGAAGKIVSNVPYKGQGGHVLQVRIHRRAGGGHQEVRRQVHLPG